MKVVYEAGVYVRMNASYDEATNIVIGSLDVGEFAETCSDMPSVVVVSPDGVHVTWVQLISHFDGWAPTSTIDGQWVLEIIPEAAQQLLPADHVLSGSLSTESINLGDLDAAENRSISPSISPSR